MSPIDKTIEEALRATEPAIAEDGFRERVLERLPRARRATSISIARYLSLAIAACAGSLITLLFGLPVDGLLENYIEYGESVSMILAPSIVVGILAAPVAWLMYRESLS
jgi:hypothetical protein